MAAMGRNIFKSLNFALARQYASNTKLVNVNVNDTTGIATVSMNRLPVNGLNLDLFNELTSNLQNLENSKCRGIILTSELPKIFSAGLDIKEVYKPDLKRITHFWNAMQDLWLSLYGSGLPIAAAINGVSIGAGCLLGMGCEYRVFVEGNHRIGLNETQLGFIAPKWVQDALINIIGHRRAEISLMRSSLYKPEEALAIGLVDELATDKADAIAKYEKYIASYDKISRTARSAAKMKIRKATISWLNENRKLDFDSNVGLIFNPEVQDNLDVYVRSMKKKSEK